MYVPEIITANTEQIRNLDPDERAIQFDRERWVRFLRDYPWAQNEANRPPIDEIFAEIQGDVITGRTIKAKVPSLPKPRIDQGPDDHQHRVAWQRLFVLVMIWRGKNTKSAMVATARSMDDRRIDFFQQTVSELLYYGKMSEAYLWANLVFAVSKNAYCTELLYFVASGIPNSFVKPLIWDRAVIRTLVANEDPLIAENANREIPKQLGGQDLDKYSEYLILIHNWATMAGCRADQIVEFLRQKGLKNR